MAHHKKAVLIVSTPTAGQVADANNRKTVLVVDDDDGVSSLLETLLGEVGYRTVTARTGRAALRLARQFHPQLITLDLGLPGVDGRQVLHRLKSDPQTRDIPIVVISAYTQVLPAGERKKLAYLLGKPFELTEVLEIIQATVGNPYV